MADNLEFSKHVPAGTETPLPKSYAPSEKIAVTPFADVQGAISNYAESSNWMSSIGSAVAARASNAVAARIGNELGKNPRGNIGPTLTEFDKTMQQSYQTQSLATLGLQANRLITESNIEMAKAPRITSGLIDSATKKVSLGLKNIFTNAPAEIQGNLEYHYGNLQLSQLTDLSSRMHREQMEDQKNNTLMATRQNAEDVYSFAMQGNDKAAIHAIETTKKLNDASVGSRVLDPLTAKTNVDTVRKSFLSGKSVHEYEKAYAAGKGEEFLKSWADHKPDYLSDADYKAVTDNLISYVGQKQSLRSQDEQLRIARFNTVLAGDPMAAGALLQELQDNVRPATYEHAQVKYISAVKKFTKDQADLTSTLSGWSDAEEFSRKTNAVKNKGFDLLVNRYADQNHVSRDEAQAVIASSAAGKVPAYIDILNTKLASTNPADIESAGKSIAYINQVQKGANLEGLNPRAKAMYGIYQSLRRSMIPQEAAQEAYKAVYTPRTEQNKKMLDDNWTDQIKDIKDAGKLTYLTHLADINIKNLVDPAGYAEQAESILYANYILTNGDIDTAKTMTADAIKNTYGESHVNGKKETTFYPLEKAVGIPEDASGYIQDDVIQFANKELESTKKAFDKGLLQFYWEIEPRRSRENIMQANHGFETENITRARMANQLAKFGEGSEMKIHKVWRNGTRETFPLIIKADPWLAKTSNPEKPYTGGWDIVAGTKNGYEPIFRELPMMGQYLVYRPDVTRIRTRFNKDHGIKG